MALSIEFEKQDEPEESLLFEELGTTGLKQFSGMIDEEFLPQLKGRKAIQVWKEMRDNDPTVGATLFALEMLMRQVSWRVEASDDSEQAQERAEFVDSNFNDMSDTWPDTLSSIFTFLPFGFSLHEEVYKRRLGVKPLDPDNSSTFNDGLIGWSKLPVRAQETIERWIFDQQTGDLKGAIQRAAPDFRVRELPMAKMLLFRTSTHKGNPEGRSMLRNGYRPWFFKKRIEEIEAIGIERDLAGLPVVQVPKELLRTGADGASKSLLEEMKRLVRNIRRDQREGVIFPLEYDEGGRELYKLSLLSTGGRRQFDTTRIVQRYDTRMAQTVLADFIMLGHERVGSFALAAAKTNLFALALNAWLDSVQDIFNRVAIPRLFMVNGFDTAELPVLVHGDIETIEINDLATIITAMTGAGLSVFDDDTQQWIREQVGMPDHKPELEEGEIGGEGVTPTAPAPGRAQRRGNGELPPGMEPPPTPPTEGTPPTGA